MNKTKKDDKNESHPNPVDPGENTPNRDTATPETDDYDHSAIYIFNKETGKWEVRNPAGSIGYNYLYRDDI